MATEAKYAGTGANTNDGGNIAWTNPANFAGDTTGTAATVNPGTINHISQQLRGTNFGFNIPPEATINGITVAIERQAASTNRHIWNMVQLLKAGTLAGDNLSTGAVINNSKSFTDFGGASDLWGTTWTPTEINNSGFGVAVKMQRTGTATTTSMFRVEITVTYSIAGTNTSQAFFGFM